jgi:hypothetical protein
MTSAICCGIISRVLEGASEGRIQNRGCQLNNVAVTELVRLGTPAAVALLLTASRDDIVRLYADYRAGDSIG